MVETKPMNYAVSRDTIGLYIFPFLARRVLALFTRFVGYTGTQALYILCTFFPKRVQTYQQYQQSFTRFVGYTGTQALYILCTFFPKRVQTYQQSTALPAFSTKCRVFYKYFGSTENRTCGTHSPSHD